VARAHDRDVALVGRSLYRIEKAARDNGYLADIPRFLTEDEAGYLPPRQDPADLHRQPGRAARRAGPHRARRPPERHAGRR